LFNNGITFKNANGVAANFGPTYTLVDQPIIQADGAAITQSQHQSVRSQPNYQTINGGTLGVTTWLDGLLIGGSIGAGVTVANRGGLRWFEPLGGGTITNSVVVEIPNMARATNNYGIQSAMAAGAGNNYLIAHNGTAPSYFFGGLQVMNNVPVTFGLATPLTFARTAAQTLTMTGAEDLVWNFGSVANVVSINSTTGASFRVNNRLDINAPIPLGGGAVATLGTIGATGPTAAAQAQWVQIDVNGVPHWIPAWI
jgi:hypothetical protein